MLIRPVQIVTAILIPAMLGACANLPRNPVPVEDIHRAEIPGMPAIRAWAGELDPDFQANYSPAQKSLGGAAPAEVTAGLITNSPGKPVDATMAAGETTRRRSYAQPHRPATIQPT